MKQEPETQFFLEIIPTRLDIFPTRLSNKLFKRIFTG